MNETEFERWLSQSKVALREPNKQLAEFDRSSSEYDKALSELLNRIEDVCNKYLIATAYQRVAIRGMFDRSEQILSTLIGYPSYVCQFIHSPKDVEWLCLGLAAALVENLRIDFRDTWIALGDLYLAAERAGINPIPYFEFLGTPTETGNPMPSNEMFRFVGSSSTSQGILKSFLRSEQLKSSKRNS